MGPPLLSIYTAAPSHPQLVTKTVIVRTGGPSLEISFYYFVIG